MSATQTQITIPSDILTTSDLYQFLRNNPREDFGTDVLRSDVQALTANIEARLAEMKKNLDDLALTQIMIQINASARHGTPLFTTKNVFKMIERIAFSGWYCFRKDGSRRTKKDTFRSPDYAEFTLANGRVWGTEATYNRVMDSELYAVVKEILRQGGPIPASLAHGWSPNAKLSLKIEKAILKSDEIAKARQAEEARRAEERRLAEEKRQAEKTQELIEAIPAHQETRTDRDSLADKFFPKRAKKAPVAEEAPETLPLDLGEDIDEALAVDRLHFEDIRRETITRILGQDVRVVEYIFPSSQIKNGRVREFFVLEGAKVGNSTLVLLKEALSAHHSFVEAKLQPNSKGKQVLMIVSKAVREFLGMKRHEKLQSETAPSTPSPETEALIEEISPAVSIPEGVKVQFHRADLKGLSFTTEGLAEKDVQGLFYEVPFDRSSGLLANWSVSLVRPLVSESEAYVPCLPLVFDWRLSPIDMEGRVKAEDLLEVFLDRFELQFGFRPAVELPPEEGLVFLSETIKLFIPIKPSYDENLVRHLRRRVQGVSQCFSISVRSKIGFKGTPLFTGFDIEVPVGTDLDDLETDLLDLTRRDLTPKPEDGFFDSLIDYTRRAQAPVAETAPETPAPVAEEAPKPSLHSVRICPFFKEVSFKTEGVDIEEIKGLMWNEPFDECSGSIMDWSASLRGENPSRFGLCDWKLSPKPQTIFTLSSVIDTFLDRFELQFGFRPLIEEGGDSTPAPVAETAPETPRLWSEEETQEGDTHQAHLDGVLVFSDDLSEDGIEGGEVVLVEIHEGGFTKAHGVFESEENALDLLDVWERSIRDSKDSVFKVVPLVQIVH